MITIKQQLRELHEELERLAPEYDLLTPVQQSDLIAMLESAASALRQEQEDWQEPITANDVQAMIDQL